MKSAQFCSAWQSIVLPIQKPRSTWELILHLGSCRSPSAMVSFLSQEGKELPLLVKVIVVVDLRCICGPISTFSRTCQVASGKDIRDASSIPGMERSLGEWQDNPLHYSCLENPMDRGAWRATAHRVTVRHNWSDLAHTFHLFFPLIVRLFLGGLLLSDPSIWLFGGYLSWYPTYLVRVKSM